MGLKEKMMDGMMGNMKPSEKQDMMNAMMDQFFSTMTAEDKQNMMDGMMDKFMGSMTAEEKQAMMQNMMPKMMGGKSGGGMMGMMKGMMGGEEGSEGPMDMCKKMIGNIGKASDLASYATGELHNLFEEWLGQINDEVADFIQKEGTADPDTLAEKFKLSRESIHFILGRLAQKGKITLRAEKK